MEIVLTVDTTEIQQRLEDEVCHQVILELAGYARHSMEASLPKSLSGGDWRTFVQQLTEEFIEDHADEIIDIAAELLARKANNKKRWHEVIKEIRNHKGD